MKRAPPRIAKYDSSVIFDGFTRAKKNGKSTTRLMFTDGRYRWMNVVRQKDGSLPFTFDLKPIPVNR